MLSKIKMSVVAKRNLIVPTVGTKRLKGCTLATKFRQVYDRFKKAIPQFLLEEYRSEYSSEAEASQEIAEMVDRAPSWGEESADQEVFIDLARCVKSQFLKKRRRR